MKKGDKVTWINGLGYECEGVVARDLEHNEFMIPVERRDGSIIKVAYKDLHRVVRKLDLLLAICKTNCEKCDEEEFLFIPVGSDYGLLCENCMNEFGLEIDMRETQKNIGR